MVFTLSPTSKSSSPFNNPSVSVQKAVITIGVIDTFMFRSFFNTLARSSFFYHSFHILSVLFCGLPELQSPQFCRFTFLLIIIQSGRLAEIRWSVSMSKSHQSLCESFSRTGVGLCIYALFIWLNLNLLHISLWNTLPSQSCQVLYLLLC